MPINNSEKRRRSRPVDGFVSNFSPINGPMPRADIANLQRREVGGFSRAEGFHPARQPLTSQAQLQEQTSTDENPEGLKSNFAGRDPLLGSKSAKDQVKLPKGSRRKQAWRWTKRGSLVAVAFVLIVGGFLFSKGYLKLHDIFKGGGHAAALQANVDPSQLKGEGDGRINILLLGNGGQGHDGPDLTDTMLLASIDPVNNKAALVSVPRDLWIKEPDNYMGTYQKINAAYEAGKYDYLNKEDPSNANQSAIAAGFKSADKAVSQVFGIPIDYNVLVDFQAFSQGVDSVGGVTVNVPTELYDPTVAWENHNNPVIALPGTQTMNGTQALLYVRSRETTSDFARTQRQRSVLVGLKDKVLTLGTLSNPLKISGLLSAFGDNIRTDISISDASALYSIVKKITNNNIQSVGLADPPNNYVTTGNVNGLSVVEPSAGEFNYSQLQTYLRSVLVDGYIAKENAKITILNGTTFNGAATNEATTLKSYGYNVGTVGNAPTNNYQNTVVVDLTAGKDKYTKHYLEQRFGVSSVTKLPDPSIQPAGADFVIIVGENDTNTASSSQT